MHMRDSEVVASIVAGDPEGLAAAYDRYADPLYKYCRTLLRDPADAADAVQDTFVIAASRLDGLRDPDALRGWLYAVARNESLRILGSRKGTSALDEAPEVTDDRDDAGDDASAADVHDDLHALLDNAADGLSPGEREVIELQLRAGLEPAEVARVLGVSRNHAHALLSRARDQLEVCLAVLLVARAGRGECDELGAMLTGWDGRLTVLLRKRVHRHIENCAACSARRAVELRPAMLLDLSPGAALAAGAVASFRLAAGVPAGLKAHTIALATASEPGAVAHRAAVLSHAGAFGRYGFPKPVAGTGKAGLAASRGGAGGAKGTLRSSPQGQAAVAAAVVLAVIIATVAFALTANSQGLRQAAGPKPPASTAAAPPAAKPTKPTLTPTTARATAAMVAATGPAPAPAPPITEPTPPAASPAPSTLGSSPTPTEPSASPTPPPSASPAPSGILAELPRGGPLLVRSGGTQIFLLATGGTVNWSVSLGNDPGNAVGVSSYSGTQTAGGAAATVTVTANRFVSCLSASYPTITINPGGAQYFVCTGWIKPFGGGGGGHGGGHGGGGHRHRHRHRAT
jgi:RNA polymerase sigma factor (sigma-70 family)